MFCLAPLFSMACSCINAGDFCTILPRAIDQGSLVVRGSSLRTIGHGMEFKIDEVISGNESKSRITIWGDPGYLCRSYVSGFDRNDDLLMILSPIVQERTESTTGKTERVGDYTLSACGQFFVYLNGKNKTDLSCYTPSKKKPQLISVFPNPTSGYFTINNNNDLETANILQINVFHANGQLLYKRSQLAVREQEDHIEIVTNDWISGLYFVEIRTTQNRWLAKLVVSE